MKEWQEFKFIIFILVMVTMGSCLGSIVGMTMVKILSEK